MHIKSERKSSNKKHDYSVKFDESAIEKRDDVRDCSLISLDY